MQRHARATARKSDKPLERYVRLLEVISGFPDGITPTDLAEMLDLPKPTAYRLVRSLADVGLVEMTSPPSAKCRLGGRLERLLFAGASDEWVRMVVRPLMGELAEKTGEACFLARFRGGTVQSIEMVAPDNLLRAYILPGQEVPLHAGATGKVLLAFQDEKTVDSVLRKPLERFTGLTKTDPDDVRRELTEVRRRGIASCIGEDVEGFSGIAVPILVPGQAVQLSLCVTGTISALIDNKRNLIEEQLKFYAAKIADILARKMNAAT